MPKKLIIEVGLNESTSKEEAASVPYSPAEIAQDIAACAEAGASIVHFHARDPETGANLMNDADSYIQTIAAVRDMGYDTFLYPTYPPYETEMAIRFQHVLALSDRPELRMEIGPLDMGSFNLIQYKDGDFAETSYMPLEYSVYANPFGHLQAMLDEYQRRSLIPSLAIFEPGHLRTTAAFLANRTQGPRPMVKFFFSEQWLHGLLPNPEGMRVYLDMMKSLQLLDSTEWVCVPYAVTSEATVVSLLEAAVTSGGHIRVGVGDCPGAAGGRSNAELVEMAVEIGHRHGRAPASPDDVRALLGA